MKIKIVVFLALLFTANSLFCQNTEQYNRYIKQADSLYNAKAYEESATKFGEAFDLLEDEASPDNWYFAACAFALANDIEQSFYHLFYLAEDPKIKFENIDQLTFDPDLENLQSDDRWSKLINIIEKNKTNAEKHLDLSLIAILDTIYLSDQGYRKQISEVEEKYGRESDEMQAHWKLIRHADSINLIKVKNILDERGWLGSDIVGNRGNSTLFLVVQHADLETQIKYLPMMREAVARGHAQSRNLALLEDRVALGRGEKQIYGSQIGRDPETGEYYVLPLFEPEKVNERRAEVGLGIIEDYISHWGITWNPQKQNEGDKRN